MEELNKDELELQSVPQDLAADDAAILSAISDQQTAEAESLGATNVLEAPGLPEDPVEVPKNLPVTNVDENNITFTPDDYQNMLGQSDEGGWQSVSQPSASQVEEVAQSPVVEPYSAPAESVPPMVVPKETEVVYAPVPAEPVSSIPSPESFYVGYDPAQQSQQPVAQSPLEKRVQELASVQQKSKKGLIWAIVGSILGVILVALGLLGYFLYRDNMDKNNVLDALIQLYETQKAEIITEAELDGQKAEVGLAFDEDKDLSMKIRFALSDEDFVADAVYINKTGKVYIKNSQLSDLNDQAGIDPNSWVEVSGLKSIMDSSSSIDGLARSLKEAKQFGKLEYLKREKSESIEGVEVYKYLFTPPAEVVNEQIKNFAPSSGGLEVKLEEPSFQFWITKTDHRLVKMVIAGKTADYGQIKITANINTNYNKDIIFSARNKVSNKLDLQDLFSSMNPISIPETDTLDDLDDEEAAEL